MYQPCTNCSAFTRLTLDEQEVLELRVVAGLSSDGAAHVLGKKPGASGWPKLVRLGVSE